jgi:multiphosphoryl transfer protein
LRLGHSNGEVVASVTIHHPQGLHLRVGKDLVHVANQFACRIAAQNLTRHSPVVDAKSILQLMQLQARQGHLVQFSADGPDAQAALTALCALLQSTESDPT